MQLRGMKDAYMSVKWDSIRNGDMNKLGER
jgi:hypothetical protein